MSLDRRAFVALGAAACAPIQARAANQRLITGVNLAGLEFKSGALPGRVDHDFVAPTREELDYYMSRGARAVRLPFLWERLEPDPGQGFAPEYWRLMSNVMTAARQRGLRIVLDPHQYGRRRVRGEARIIGETSEATADHFTAFWLELAGRCREWPDVIFGLQNEPHDQDRPTLVRLHNATIAALRRADITNLILVPGSAWSGAHSWVSSGNAEAMLAIRDPSNNFAFDVHQFLDRDFSGTHAECAPNSGARLERFTAWARENGKRGFLGEFGAGPSETCITELSHLLDHIAQNRDVWLGWTCWAGGPWWDDDYPLRLDPESLENPQDRPQMAVLRRYFE